MPDVEEVPYNPSQMTSAKERNRRLSLADLYMSNTCINRFRQHWKDAALTKTKHPKGGTYKTIEAHPKPR